MSAAKELVTRIKLDAVDFKKSMGDAKNAALAFSAAAIGAGAAVLMMTKAAADQIDATTKLARSAGMTTEAFSALSYSAKLADMDQETLAKGLAKMTTDKARAEIQKLGISLTDLAGHSKTQEQLISDISDKIANTANPIEKTRIAMDIFGKSGAQFVTLLSGGSEELKNLATEARDLGQVFSEDAGKNAELFNDNLTRLQTGISGVSNQIGQSVIKLVNQSGVVVAATDKVKELIKWWQGLSDESKNLILNVVGITTALGLLTGALVGLAMIMPTISAAFTAAFVTNPIGIVIVALAGAVAIAYELADAFMKTDSAAAKAAIALVAFMSPIVAIAAGIFLIVKNWDMLSAHIGAFKVTVMTILQPVLDFIGNIANKIKTFVSELSGGEMSGILSMIKGIMAVKFDFPDVTRLFLENVVLPIRGAMYAVKNMILVGLPQAWIEASNLVKDIVTMMSTNIRASLAAALDPNSTIDISSLWSGAGATILSKISTTAKSIGDKLASEMARGIAEGKKEGLASLLQYDEALANRLREIAERNRDRGHGGPPPPPGGGDVAGPAVNQFAGINNSIVDLIKNLGDLKTKMDAAQGFGPKLAFGLEMAKASVQALGSAFTQMLQAQNAAKNAALANLKQTTDFQLQGIEFLIDQTLAATQRENDAELAAVQAQKDALVAEEQAYQERIQAIKDQYSETRQAELDAELKGEFDRMDEQYQRQIEALRASGVEGVELDAKKAEALAQLEAKKNQLISQSRDKLASDTKKNDDKLAKEKDQHDKDQAKKADELAAQEKAIQDKKAADDAAAAEQKKNLEKGVKLFEWAAGKGAFEASKQAQIAQAEIGMAMGVLNAVQAGAMLAATVPVVGWVLGPILAATMSAMVLTAGHASISAASAMQYPPPPVFADGGIATGPSIFGEAGPEMAIPLNRPGRDFGALKDAVAERLVGNGPANREINPVINNYFAARDDYETIKNKLNEDFRDMFRSAVA